jgi:hypothetical protein
MFGCQKKNYEESTSIEEMKWVMHFWLQDQSE